MEGLACCGWGGGWGGGGGSRAECQGERGGEWEGCAGLEGRRWCKDDRRAIGLYLPVDSAFGNRLANVRKAIKDIGV